MSQQQIIAAQVAGGAGAAGTVDVTVSNGTLSTIPKGSIVDWNWDATTGVPQVVPSSSTDTPGGVGSATVGMLLADLTDIGTASCRLIGPVTGLDTHSFFVGGSVYAGDNGAMVDFDAGGDFVGMVMVSDATNGTVFVSCGLASLASVPTHSHNAQRFGSGGALQQSSFTERDAATIDTPADTTYQHVFIDVSDHKLKRKDHAGTVTIIG